MLYAGCDWYVPHTWSIAAVHPSLARRRQSTVGYDDENRHSAYTTRHMCMAINQRWRLMSSESIISGDLVRYVCIKHDVTKGI